VTFRDLKIEFDTVMLRLNYEEDSFARRSHIYALHAIVSHASSHIQARLDWLKKQKQLFTAL
jgi:hypothetical protein